jgi:DDB1- and CUL4-associated factor 11
MAYDPSEPEPPALKRQEREDVCVRDVSWHSQVRSSHLSALSLWLTPRQEPILMSVGWKNRRSGSNVVRHEWKGLSKLGNRVEDWVDRESAEYVERSRAPATRSATGQIPGAYVDSDMAEEDSDWTDEDDL